MSVVIAFLSADRSIADDFVFFTRQIPAVDDEQFPQQPRPVDVAQSEFNGDRDIAHRVAEIAALAARPVGSGFLIGVLVARAGAKGDSKYHAAGRGAGGRAVPLVPARGPLCALCLAVR